MADTLNAIYDPTLTITFTKGTTTSSVMDRVVTNSGSMPTMRATLINGSGANKANKRYVQLHTFAVGNTDLDLQTLTDERTGGTITFTKIKWFFLRLRSPATTIKLVVGNYGANGWTGWMGGTSQTTDVFYQLAQKNQIDGWTVSGALRYLRINNPGVATVSADLILVGE